MIKQIQNPQEKQDIATQILHGLPEWFGLPESTANYIEESQNLPFLAYFEGDLPLGFAAMKPTSPHTADIFVMGVRKDAHRQGIGRKLYEGLENMARELGYLYMQVKTVKMGHYDSYDATNRFYIAMGFVELECFPELWDEWNPCQIYIKYIKQ